LGVLSAIQSFKEQEEEHEEDNFRQNLKTANEQVEFNKSLKDEDALYKVLAYKATLERKRMENPDATRKNPEVLYGMVRSLVIGSTLSKNFTPSNFGARHTWRRTARERVFNEFVTQLINGVLGFWGFGEIGRASCRERV